MLVVYLTHFALSMLLTTWGASLVLRAFAARRAARREASSTLRSALPANVWHKHPTSLRRLAITALLGLLTVLLGAACFSVRHLFDADQQFHMPRALSELATGLLLAGALAAALLGSFADRAKGRLRCPRCWYDMQGQPTLQCPECGHVAKGRRDLQRTRRSRDMFLLAVVLLLFTAVPDVVRGYRRTGAIGTVPTWAMVLLVDVLPQTWIVQSGLDEDYGPLGDRIDSMPEYQARVAYRFVRTSPPANWQDRVSSIAAGMTKSNRRALADSSQTLQNLAAKDGGELDAMERRYRQLLGNWPPANTASALQEQAEVGYLAAILTFSRTGAVRGVNAPHIPTSFVESMLAGPLPPTLGTWYLRYVFEARVASPSEVTPIFLAAFDRDINNTNQVYLLTQLFSTFISRNPDELPVVYDYLRNSTRAGRGGVLRMWYGSGNPNRPSDELLVQLRADSDPRVAVAAYVLPYSPLVFSRPDPNCDGLIRIYNTGPMPDDWCLDQLLRMQCDVNGMTPGLLRDLSPSNPALAWSIVAMLDKISPTDPKLLPALKALNTMPAAPPQASMLAGVIMKLEAANAAKSQTTDPAAITP